MISGILFFNKSYNIVEYLSTTMLALGLILFSLADAKLGNSTLLFTKTTYSFTIEGSFNVVGVILMCCSVWSEAMKATMQEKVMKVNKCSEVDVVCPVFTYPIFFLTILCRHYGAVFSESFLLFLL